MKWTLAIVCCLFFLHTCSAQTAMKAALKRIDERSTGLAQSACYKQVSPQAFVEQLKHRIQHPYELKQGRTLFCWAAIPIAFLYDRHPVEMVDATFNLYTTGDLDLHLPYRQLILSTSKKCRRAVGTASFSGRRNQLKGRLLDQMVFLAFAENYSCWLNIDKRYNRGDQVNPLWAGATLDKEREIWQDLGFHTESGGSDLKWDQPGKAEKIASELASGKLVALYLNTFTFYDQWLGIGGVKIIPPIPVCATHFVMATKLERTKKGYALSYWDKSGHQRHEVSPETFQQAVFGYTAADSSVLSVLK